MSSIEELRFNNKQLKKAMTREWLKQAYLRKQHEIELSTLYTKICSLESIIADQSSSQDNMLEEALELTEGTSGITPRFMSPRLASIGEEPEEEECGDLARQCFGTLNLITSGMHKLTEVQSLIVNQYKVYVDKVVNLDVITDENERLKEEVSKLQASYIEGESFSELKTMYDKENSKVTKLTSTLKDLQGEFNELQDVVEDLRVERENLQSQLHRQGDTSDFNDLKKQLRQMEKRIGSNEGSNVERLNDKIRKLERENQELVADLEYTEEQLKGSVKERKKVELEMSRIETELGTVQNEYQKLIGETSGISNISPRKDDELYQQLNKLEDEKADLIEQIKHLTHERSGIEKAKAELEEQTEFERDELSQFRQLLAEYEEENATKEAALEKAQQLIKKLNDECERTVKDLKKSESEVGQLKKDNRNYEKAYVDARKQMNEVDVFKKTEERLRGEIMKLKDEIMELNKVKDMEIDDLSNSNEQLFNEKQHLEKSIELLEEKLVEIQEQYKTENDNQVRVDARLNELEVILGEKDEVIARLIKEGEAREEERDAEITHLKRQAENAMRNLQNFRASDEKTPAPYSVYSKLNTQGRSRQPNKSPMRKKSQVKMTGGHAMHTTGQNKENEGQVVMEDTGDQSGGKMVVSPASLNNLNLQLEESLDREAALKKAIEHIVAEGAKYLKENLDTIARIEGQARPELERWLMRNEDLESHLFYNQDRNVRLWRALSDYKKTIQIKNRQISDQRKIHDQLRSELDSLVDFLQIELQDKNNLIFSEVLPHSQNCLTSALSTSHEKLNQLKNDLDMLRTELAKTNEALQREQERGNILQMEKEEALHTSSRCMEDLAILERECAPGHIGEISERLYTKHAANIADRLVVLKRKEQDLESMTQARDLLQANLENLHKELTESQRFFNEEIANKDKAHNDQINSMNETYLNETKILKNRLTELDQSWNLKCQSYLDERDEMSRKLRQAKELAHKDSLERTAAQERLEQKLEASRKDFELQGNDKQRLESNTVMLSEKTDELEMLLNQERNRFTSEYENKKSQVKHLEVELDKITQFKWDDDTTKGQEMQLMRDQLSTLNRNNEILKANEAKLNYEVTESSQTISNLRQQLERQPSHHNRSRSDHERMFQGTDERVEDTAFGKSMAQTIQQKNEIIRDLESQIGHLKSSNTDLLAMSQSINVDLNALNSSQKAGEDPVLRLKRKRESDKKSFQKRVKEFELILRYLEEKIKVATGEPETPREPQMNELISELTSKNATLEQWLNMLCHRLDNFSHDFYVNKLRERQTYQEICSFLIEQSNTPTDIAEYKTLFNHICDSNDLDNNAKRLIEKLKQFVRNVNLTSPRGIETYAGISGVSLSITHADILSSANQKAAELERGLSARSEFVIQFNAKMDEISHRVVSRPEKVQLLLNAVNSCIRDLSGDLQNDAYNISDIARNLNEVCMSSSDIEPNRLTTMGSYNRKSSRGQNLSRPYTTPRAVVHLDDLLSTI